MSIKQFIKLSLIVFLLVLVVVILDPTCFMEISALETLFITIPIAGFLGGIIAIVWFELQKWSLALIIGILTAYLVFVPASIIAGVIRLVFGDYTIIPFCHK